VLPPDLSSVSLHPNECRRRRAGGRERSCRRRGARDSMECRRRS